MIADPVARAGTARGMGVGSRDPQLSRADLLEMPLRSACWKSATFYTMFTSCSRSARRPMSSVCRHHALPPARRRGHHQGVLTSQHSITIPVAAFEGRQFQLGQRLRVPRRLRKCADGADLEGHLRAISPRKALARCVDGFASGNPPKPGPVDRPSVGTARGGIGPI